MTVYSKTNAGRILAFEQKPSVPPAMRDLLRRVDGKTTHQQLISQPGDAELFDELCLRQLVKIAVEPWRNSQASPTDRRQETVPTATDAPHGFDVTPPVLTPPVTQPDSKIEAIKGLMSGFICSQLPMHANVTLAEINALKSEADLLCMLSGYMNLVNPAGLAGQEHVQNLLLALAASE